MRPHLAILVLWSLILVGSATLARANPTPVETGWTVRKVADGFGLNFNGLAYDPVSTDLFTTDFDTHSIIRVTQTGAKTVIHSDASFDFDEMAFDPTSRILYFGGVGQSVVRKINEFGVFIEDVTAPGGCTGMAFAPDGRLYVNSAYTNVVWRYNEIDDSFTQIHAGVGSGILEGLAFDPSGNAFVANYTSNAVLKITPGGSVTTIGAIGNAIGVAYGDGSVFVTTDGSEVFRVAPDGTSTTSFATGHTRAAGIHFAANDRLYVNSDSSIWEYSRVPTRTVAATWGSLKARYR